MARLVRWSAEARADLRAIDRETALRLLKALDRFLKTDAGNVIQLEGFDPPLFRLRIGAWRFIYRKADGMGSKSSGSATAKTRTAECIGPWGSPSIHWSSQHLGHAAQNEATAISTLLAEPGRFHIRDFDPHLLSIRPTVD